MMSRLFVSMVVLSAGLQLACGGNGGNGGTDGGPSGPTDEAYFQLAVGTCHVLRGGLGGAQEMTIGVEVENDALGFTTRQIRYRLGGFLRRTDYVSLESGQVLIHQRSEVGTPSTDLEFDPPILWLERPYAPTGTDPLLTETTATDVFSQDQSTWTVRVSVQAPESTTVPAHSEGIEAYPTYVVYEPAGAGQQQDFFHLAPESGFVRADLSGDEWPAMALHEVRQIAEGSTTCTGN